MFLFEFVNTTDFFFVKGLTELTHIGVVLKIITVVAGTDLASTEVEVEAGEVTKATAGEDLSMEDTVTMDKDSVMEAIKEVIKEDTGVDITSI